MLINNLKIPILYMERKNTTLIIFVVIAVFGLVMATTLVAPQAHARLVKHNGTPHHLLGDGAIALYPYDQGGNAFIGDHEIILIPH